MIKDALGIGWWCCQLTQHDDGNHVTTTPNQNKKVETEGDWFSVFDLPGVTKGEMVESISFLARKDGLYGK